ncbi:MAG: AzlC family ABC transporter permease [Proteobacteria bacterium]|nr:AzlC family ABC transporter permease [Pseudomonadota bacterium]
MSNKFKYFVQGSLETSLLFLPVIPFGIIFGVIGMDLGFGPYVTYATSFIIFAGSTQLVFLQLVSGGASSLVTLTSVAFNSSRHLLYGAVFAQYLNKFNLFWKILLSYLLTDQAFAASAKFFKKNSNKKHFHYHLLGSGLSLWAVWQISTLLGIFLGAIVPDELGLSFTIPLTFIALLVDKFKKLDHLLIMLFSGIVAILAYNMPLKAYIIVSALLGLGLAFIFSRKKQEK